MNAKIAHKYLKENNNVTISIQTLTKVYKELRKIIYKYMKILYKSEPISVKNKNEFFSMDESLINQKMVVKFGYSELSITKQKNSV